jgi:hypothetical protein
VAKLANPFSLVLTFPSNDEERILSFFDCELLLLWLMAAVRSIIVLAYRAISEQTRQLP